MTIKQLLSVTVALSTFVGCSGDFSQTISISKDTIQGQVDGYFPMSTADMESVDLPVVVVISDGVVLMEEGSDQLGLEAKVRVDAPDVDVPQPKTPPRPPGPGPPGLSPPTDPPAQSPPKTINGTIAIFGEISYNANEGAFYFTNPQIKEMNFEQLPPQFETPAQKGAELLLGKYLSNNSVYTLSDEETGTRAAKSVLKSVTVKDGKLQVEIGI